VESHPSALGLASLQLQLDAPGWGTRPPQSQNIVTRSNSFQVLSTHHSNQSEANRFMAAELHTSICERLKIGSVEGKHDEK
jgi:hypothetical protein